MRGYEDQLSSTLNTLRSKVCWCLPHMLATDISVTHFNLRLQRVAWGLKLLQHLFQFDERCSILKVERRRRDRVLPSDYFRRRPSLVEADGYSKTWMLTFDFEIKQRALTLITPPLLGSGSRRCPAKSSIILEQSRFLCFLVTLQHARLWKRSLSILWRPVYDEISSSG